MSEEYNERFNGISQKEIKFHKNGGSSVCHSFVNVLTKHMRTRKAKET